VTGPPSAAGDAASGGAGEDPAIASPATTSGSKSGRTATIVFAGILVSRVTGLARNWVFARYLGDSAAADAYNTAIRIPNIVRNLLGEGTISASFIPVYSGLLGKGDEKAARALANAMLGILLAAVSILTILGIALAEPLTALLAAGFEREKTELTARLVRVLFPMTGLMVISGWCLGIQNSHRRFFNSYASAAAWSIAQIALLLWKGPHTPSLAELAWWLAWATLAGSALQVAVQIPEVLRLVRPIRPSLDIKATGVADTLRNFVPVVVALGLFQISSLIDLQIASFLPDGAIADLGYASTLYLLPLGLFGLSIAASSLPEFSRDNAMAKRDALRDRLRDSWVRILFYILPTTAAFIVYGDLVIALVLRSGRFGAEETRIVHWILAAYSVGLVSYSSVRLLASAFYAMQDYKTPLRGALYSIVVGGMLAASIALPLRKSLIGAAGIALGSGVASYINLATLARGLRSSLGKLFTPEMWHGVRRIVIGTVAATVLAYPVKWLLSDAHYLIRAIATLMVFGGIFLGVTHRLGSGEAARLLRSARLVRR
jgi:putative peptidoglycan lipid II flippase